MTTNWTLDEKFIAEVIKRGYTLLEDDRLPKSKRKSIKTDLDTFIRFQNGDFENKSGIIPKPPRNIDKLKNYILKRMKAQYDELGEELILWTMDLYFEKIFEIRGRCQKTKLTIDEQKEITLENYDKNSKLHLKIARPILSDDIIRQVQNVPYLDSSSYCYYDEITTLPFIIVDAMQAPWILNHETEHAVEEIKKISGTKYYSELGPILFELLFNDILYKNQGFLNKGDYSDRMIDTEETLVRLVRYFDVMLTFKQHNFEVPTDLFLREFSDVCDLDTEEGLKDFLREEIAPADIVDDMTYMYSYLKAIELREKHNPNEDFSYAITPHIKSKKINFTPSENSFEIYRNFTREMQEKTHSK